MRYYPLYNIIYRGQKPLTRTYWKRPGCVCTRRHGQTSTNLCVREKIGVFIKWQVIPQRFCESYHVYVQYARIKQPRNTVSKLYHVFCAYYNVYVSYIIRRQFVKEQLPPIQFKHPNIQFSLIKNRKPTPSINIYLSMPIHY